MSKELEAINDIEKAFKLILNADISTTKEFKLIKQALTELETLRKKHKFADETLAYIGEILVDVSKSHITERKAIEDIRKYTSAYHNKHWSDENE